ncbi:RagB/SusD family nutrient uptake outer membrane protein [Olivibacter sp. XZL3]|uniref:RagB/SusD family nutrient uptake outer membrane protein n=1 Tax=Olivibacter sp. XZL3 TaxID=1735116 RepID=UPI001F10ACE2|nr:RagB/SusD family nutrient uptake outer membrane protein [Olivibacter sp. XZL3]
MKNKLKLLLLTTFCVLTLFSCKKDFLDTPSQEEFTDEMVWSDPALVETFLNEIYFRLYEPLTDGRGTANIVDEGHYRGNSASTQFNNSLSTQDNLYAWGYQRFLVWNELYKSIRYCNIYFSKVDEIPFTNEVTDGKTDADRMTGEAHFLRAFLYHYLLSLYGGVPLITEPFDLGSDFAQARNSYADGIAFVVAECDKAAALLPDIHSGSNLGRATRGAALALKSRALLYAASDLHSPNPVTSSFAEPALLGYTDNNRTERWQKAKDAAKAVIDLDLYQLHKAEPAAGDSVAQHITEIFLTNNTEEDIFVKFFTQVMGQRWGLYSSPNGYYGWGVNAPIANFVDAFQMADGTPFDWNNPAHAENPYANREPRFYATLLYNGASWRERPTDAKGLDPDNKIQTGVYKRWNASNNSEYETYGIDTRNGPIENWNGSYTGYYCRKYIDPAINVQYLSQSVTWRFFRYTEILLNYAEACLELGQEEEARTYINRIRKRAGLPATSASGTALRALYRNERRIELAFEEHRFFDVRRWMIGPEAYSPAYQARVIYPLAANNTTSSVPTITHVKFEDRSWNDKSYFFPIFRDELNKNNLLIQNPGY